MIQCNVKPGDIVIITDKSSFAYNCVGRVLSLSGLTSNNISDVFTVVLDLELISGNFKGFRLACYEHQIKYSPTASLVFNDT